MNGGKYKIFHRFELHSCHTFCFQICAYLKPAKQQNTNVKLICPCRQRFTSKNLIEPFKATNSGKTA